MARPKKPVVPPAIEVPEGKETPKKTVIHPLSVDFPSEQLNDMARKLNEVIEELNG